MQPQFVQNEGTNALKIVISGSYKKTGDGEIVDFEDVEIIMPVTSEEQAIAAARKRYAYTAVKAVIDNKTGEKKYPKPIEHVRNVYIDDLQEITHEFEYVGKGIKQMDEMDLQHLAVEKGIREIPLPRRQSGISMREMRQKAYLLFADRVLGWDIDMTDAAQNNYAKWNDIIPNPVQKAKPVKQKTVEEQFGEKEKGEDKVVSKHVAPQEPPKATAPHMVDPAAVEVQEAAPQVVFEPAAPKKPAKPKKAAKPKLPVTTVGGEDELTRLQRLADDNDIEYAWDTDVDELKRDLESSGVKV